MDNMITEEDEYFLRASILLLKGGRLMSKETLYKELRKSGGNLDVLLKRHERKFKHKFVKKQREKLFPDVGVTDVETWDLAMLTAVSLTVFKESLNEDEKNDLKSIKSMRDEIYAHTYSSSLSADQYEEIRKELQNALTSLSNRLSEKLKDDCSKIIQECTIGPISPSLKAELTKQIEDTEHALQAVMNKLRNQNEFLCQMRKDIMDKLNQISVTEDRSKKIIKVIDTELTLSGAVNESKDIDFVEGIITTVINKAIKKVGNENDYPRIRSVVDKILKDIENMPDVEIQQAEHKCILLKFRCTTYIGILNLLMYFESRSFLDSLNNLALALSSTLPNVSGQFRLDATVTPECMKDLLDELRAKTIETTKYERTIRVPIKVTSAQGIKHIWSLFETGGATNRLNELSEAVFDELNTKILVTPSVNLEQVQAAIQEAGEKSAEVSQVVVEDSVSSSLRHQSKSSDEDETSTEVSHVAVKDNASSSQRHQSKSANEDAHQKGHKCLKHWSTKIELFDGSYRMYNQISRHTGKVRTSFPKKKKILDEPLNIGANVLLRGVEFSYCGWIHVLCSIRFWRKWKPRYTIISQGCLYFYTDRNAQKTEYSCSLKQFEDAVECDPESGENICFCLRYKNAQTPLLFSCDTSERRKIWIEKFSLEISEVQSTYNVSADSGFGSADTVPRNRLRSHHGREEPSRYDEIDERNIEGATCSPVQACDIPCPLSGTMSTDASRFYENVKTKYTDTFQSERQTELRVQPGKISKEFTEELKLKVGRRQTVSSSMAEKGPLPTRKSTGSQSSLSAHSLAPSFSSTESSFMSICGATEESLSHLSVRKQESLYVNATVGSNNSDNTSRKTRYENTEEFESMQRFERCEYFCDQKEEVKRLSDRMTDGVFAIFPGESTKHELCVKTPKGLKYFRIYWQNGQVSLYKSHQCDTFSSLDDLLSYYTANDLPAADYSVKLQRGYNSMS